MLAHVAFHDGRGRRLHVIAVLTATLVAAPAASAREPLPDTTEAYGVVLKDWTARHKVQRAIVVVRREGRIVYRSAAALTHHAGAPREPVEGHHRRLCGDADP
jgi:hypothetical protein